MGDGLASQTAAHSIRTLSSEPGTVSCTLCRSCKVVPLPEAVDTPTFRDGAFFWSSLETKLCSRSGSGADRRESTLWLLLYPGSCLRRYLGQIKAEGIKNINLGLDSYTIYQSTPTLSRRIKTQDARGVSESHPSPPHGVGSELVPPILQSVGNTQHI